VAALAVIGCGPIPPPGAEPPRVPQAAEPVTARPTPPPSSAAARAPADTVVSGDAQDVLATIPEPLPASERVPPPEAPVPPGASAPAEEGDAGAADVPVPTPTRPLGAKPPSITVLTDTTARAPVASPPPALPPPVFAPPAPSGPPSRPEPTPERAAGDSCWRVQVAAPTEKDQGDRTRQAAESVLLAPMVVEIEGRYYKVRTRDCMERLAAERLRDRAEASGFSGAFRFLFRTPKP
jgi:hypothetical protein